MNGDFKKVLYDGFFNLFILSSKPIFYNKNVDLISINSLYQDFHINKLEYGFSCYVKRWKNIFVPVNYSIY